MQADAGPIGAPAGIDLHQIHGKTLAGKLDCGGHAGKSAADHQYVLILLNS